MVGDCRPEIMLSVVVLPQPEGPTRIRNSPSRTSRLIPLTAVKLPNVFTRSLIRIRATGLPYWPLSTAFAGLFADGAEAESLDQVLLDQHPKDHHRDRDHG